MYNETNKLIQRKAEPMTKIKLCGLTRECDIEYANELKPDYIGYVFVPDRRRFIPYETARQLTLKLHPDITPVGVFINETIGRICELVKNGTIRAVQLHGAETPDYVHELKAELEKIAEPKVMTSDSEAFCPILQAIQIHSKADLEKAIQSPADYILLDSGTGTGKTFDWTLPENIKRDFFLAGGLGPQNVAAAIQTLHPYGVDTSSALETDGLKDFQKMKQFVEAVRHRTTDT